MVPSIWYLKLLFMFAKFHKKLEHEGRENAVPLFLALYVKNSTFAEVVHSFDYLAVLW